MHYDGGLTNFIPVRDHTPLASHSLASCCPAVLCACISQASPSLSHWPGQVVRELGAGGSLLPFYDVCDECRLFMPEVTKPIVEEIFVAISREQILRAWNRV